MKVQLLSSVLATTMLVVGCSSAASVAGSSEEARPTSAS